MAKILKEEEIGTAFSVGDLLYVLKNLDPNLAAMGGFRRNLEIKRITLKPDPGECIDDLEYICIEEM